MSGDHFWMSKVVGNRGEMEQKPIKIDLGMAFRVDTFFSCFFMGFGVHMASKMKPGATTNGDTFVTFLCPQAVWAPVPPLDLDFSGFLVLFGQFSYDSCMILGWILYGFWCFV